MAEKFNAVRMALLYVRIFWYLFAIKAKFGGVFIKTKWQRIALAFWIGAKLYIPSTLKIDLILWHTQLIVCAV